MALFSLEMDNEGMLLRLLSQLSGIPLERLRLQRLNDKDGGLQPGIRTNQPGSAVHR